MGISPDLAGLYLGALRLALPEVKAFQDERAKGVLVLRGPEVDLEEARKLYDRLAEAWKAALPSSKEGKGKVEVFSLPKGVPPEAVEKVAAAVAGGKEGWTFSGERLVCLLGEEACASLKQALEALGPSAPEGTPSALVAWFYPVYGKDAAGVADALVRAFGEELKAEGGSVERAPGGILVKASRPMHERIHALLERIDPAEKEGKGEMRGSYRLRHAQAEKILPLLKSTYPDVQFSGEGEMVTWKGEPEKVREVGRILQEMDRPKPQVVYRVLMVTTSDDNWSAFESALNAVLRSGLQVSLGKGVGLGGVLPPDVTPGLEAALQAAESKGWGRVVLNGTLVAVDENTSKINSGGRLSFLGGGSSSGGSSGSGGSGGGNQQAQAQASGGTVDFEYGLVLEVTPTVRSDSLVLTKVKLEVTEEPDIGSAGGGVYVRLPRKKVEGEYGVPVGGVLAIGGVLSAEEHKTRRGIPILMDIPLLGALFSSETSTVRREYLMVYLIPEQLIYPPYQGREPKYESIDKEAKVPLSRELPPQAPSPLPSEGSGKAGAKGEAASPSVPSALSTPSTPSTPVPPSGEKAATGKATPSQEFKTPAPQKPQEGVPPLRYRVRLVPTPSGTLLVGLEGDAPPEAVWVNGGWARLIPLGKFHALAAPFSYGEHKVLLGGERRRAVFEPRE